MTVSAPWRSSERRILAVIRDAEAWVLRKLEIWSALPARNQSWTHGDRIKYLGRDLTLQLSVDDIATLVVIQDHEHLSIALPNPADRDAVRAAVIAWYRRHAQSNFSARVGEFASRLGVALPRMLISNARTRWGSCNARREVRLNWRLIQATQPTIDYVVVHELAHLIEMNHSRRFWNVVESVCPHYREGCAELNRMGLYYLDI